MKRKVIGLTVLLLAVLFMAACTAGSIDNTVFSISKSNNNDQGENNNDQGGKNKNKDDKGGINNDQGEDNDAQGETNKDKNDKDKNDDSVISDDPPPAEEIPVVQGSFGLEMVQIPAGTLTWGFTTITLTSFKIGKYEVTQNLYQEVMGSNPSYFNGESNREPASGEVQGNRPVEQVTWYDAIEFCNKLSEKEGLQPVYIMTDITRHTDGYIIAATVTATWTNNGYRLPTEAQWEYACRAGSTTGWHSGDTESELVNYAWLGGYSAESTYLQTHEVGKKKANAWGLYDMHGNVSEWCWDLYKVLPRTNEVDYKGAVTGTGRVCRGGNWNNSAWLARSDSRNFLDPKYRQWDFGFRLVLP